VTFLPQPYTEGPLHFQEKRGKREEKEEGRKGRRKQKSTREKRGSGDAKNTSEDRTKDGEKRAVRRNNKVDNEKERANFAFVT